MTPSTDTPLSRDVVQNLLNYIDILYPNGEPINPVESEDQDGYPIFKGEVIRFFQLVGLMELDYRYDYDIITTYQMTLDPEKIAAANWKEVRQMLMFMARSDRFSCYAHVHVIQRGNVRWLLLRLKQLAEQSNS